MTDATINLGSESDAALMDALKITLSQIGASVSEPDWALGGSQDIMSMTADVDGLHIRIESETYFGLTLTGEQRMVENIAERVAEMLPRSNAG